MNAVPIVSDEAGDCLSAADPRERTFVVPLRDFIRDAAPQAGISAHLATAVVADLLLRATTMEPEGKDRRGADDRRATPRGGRREDDPAAEERARREQYEQYEQQVVKFLRKQDPK